MDTKILKKAIRDDVSAFLMTDKVEVDVQKDTMMNGLTITVGILIGGLSYSFSCDEEGLQTSLQVALKMFQAQLVLYALECLHNKHKASVPQAIVPNITNTIIYSNPTEALNHYTELVSVVNSFPIFEGTYYNLTNNHDNNSRTAKRNTVAGRKPNRTTKRK